MKVKKILILGSLSLLIACGDKAIEDKSLQADSAETSSEIQEQSTLKDPLRVEHPGDVHLREGEAFLAENKLREGIRETESGLQYEVLVEGTGDSPLATDVIVAHYTGKHLDGSVFDSSIGGEPLVYPANSLIPGWTEALQLMKVGSKWIIYVPGHLGYGSQGTPGGPIMPNETLIFEMELLGINK